MAEPVTQAQFYAAMQEADAQNQQRHTRVRDAMAEGFLRLEAAMKEHAKDDLVVANDVLVIKTERDGEAKQAVRRSTWIALLISVPGGLVALYTLLRGAVK